MFREISGRFVLQEIAVFERLPRIIVRQKTHVSCLIQACRHKQACRQTPQTIAVHFVFTFFPLFIYVPFN